MRENHQRRHSRKCIHGAAGVWLPILVVVLVACAGSRWEFAVAAERPVSPVKRADGNRQTYLDENNPYYPHRDFPKLITPQWVGEEGVDCVVVLAIDDMKEPAKYEAYLRPILNRLKKIDGRAPVSVMTCSVRPDDPQLAQWLAEGLSLEVHTVDHPCPLLSKGDFAKAKSTYDRCVDLLHEIPGNKPVAFRMPCCDSLNTVSPRFYAEIFNKTTPRGNFLSISSSVFNLYSANDPALPRELVIDADGREKFRKYLPQAGVNWGGRTHGNFVNYIKDYPYPYVINRLCWEFPCVVPSDWSAQHLQKPNNPDTVRDLKAALDITVLKQGVFNLVFHPHGWIKAEQIVELIDHAVEKHGKKVKFLNFREALERLERNVLDQKSLRTLAGNDGLRMIDLHRRLYTRAAGSMNETSLPAPLPDGISVLSASGRDAGLRFVDIDEDGHDDIVFSNSERYGVYLFENMQTGWSRVALEGTRQASGGRPSSEGNPANGASKPGSATPPAPPLPKGGKTEASPGGKIEIPPIVRADGTDNGFFVHSRALYWQNEETDKLPDLVHRVSFNEILAQADLPPRAKSPEASLQSIQVRPGFKVELMAAEPLTYDPIAFAFGADGKLWVVEMGDYPLGTSTKRRGVLAGDVASSNDGIGVKPAGRIRFLEDTDGDGRYDKSTIFLDVPYPTGVLPWRKGILVTAAPDIFYAEDSDGDGRADKREVLYTGFNPGNQQHRVNGLVRGLDNWIYVANGDSGGRIRYVGRASGGREPPEDRNRSEASTPRNATPPAPPLPKGGNGRIDIGGRDLRIRPETGELEAVSGQTQYGRNRDDWGNWFGCNNANPMYQFVLDDHYQRRNPHFAAPAARVDVPEVAGTAPVYPISRLLARFNDYHTANRFTSACSAIIYRDDLFGPHFAGNMFVSEPVHNLVHREVVRPEGLLFKSRRAVDDEHSEFLASSDNWFRPTMIQTGPDGALWIADMYRHVIEHPKWIPDTWQKKLDLLAGFDKGRIYRVFPIDRQPRAIPRLDKLDAAGLVAALESPSGWQRDTAQQLLVERFGPGGPVLARPERRAAAECILLLEKQARESRNPLARLHALCTLAGIAHPSASLLMHSLADSHPGVRRHAIRISESLPRRPPEVVAALVKLVSDSDPHVRMQLAYTLGEIDDSQAGVALGDMLQGLRGDRYLFAAAMSSLTNANIEPVLSAVLRGDDGTTPNVNLLETLLNQAAALGNDRAFHTLLAAVAAPRDDRFAPWQLSAVGALFEALDRRRQSLAELRKSNDEKLQEALRNLDRLLAFARETAIDNRADEEVRIAAVRVLGRDQDQRQADCERLAELLTSRTAPELQSAAVAALGRSSDPQMAELLLEPWRGYGPARRAQVLDVLLSREAWIEKLLSALEAQQVSAADFDAARRQKLVRHRTENIRSRGAKLLAVAANADRQEIIEQYRPALVQAGDTERGAQVFAKQCAGCHKLGETGYDVGPDLASLTDKSPEALLTAILDPNRAVEAKFVSYAATTTGGQTISGILADETGNSITLRGPERKDQTILRGDLEELTSTSKSAMPEGLEKDLSRQDIADVVAYLRGTGPIPKRKEFPGNHPALVKPSPEGVLLLTAATAEIFGTTLIFEPQTGNLGYWSSVDDYAAWRADVPQAGKYRAEFHWSCDESVAGNRWRLEGSGGALTGEVGSTGNWETYRQEPVGELQLERGEQRIVLRPARRPQGALIDLRSVRLTPIR